MAGSVKSEGSPWLTANDPPIWGGVDPPFGRDGYSTASPSFTPVHYSDVGSIASNMSDIYIDVPDYEPVVPINAFRARPYSRRRVANRTSVGTRVGKVHGPFRGSLSTMPKLSWQHLAPGHYIAKARQGMTPGIRQHVLKLLSRASGYVWINGRRMSVKAARGHLLKLLATRASVDIKLTNDFPHP